MGSVGVGGPGRIANGRPQRIGVPKVERRAGPGSSGGGRGSRTFRKGLRSPPKRRSSGGMRRGGIGRVPRRQGVRIRSERRGAERERPRVVRRFHRFKLMIDFMEGTSGGPVGAPSGVATLIGADVAEERLEKSGYIVYRKNMQCWPRGPSTSAGGNEGRLPG